MEVHFTPDEEARLTQMAGKAGTDPERLVKDVLVRYLDDEAQFVAAVEKWNRRGRARRVYRGRRDGRPGRTHVHALMRIRWMVPAAEDLEGIRSYLEEHYPQFAEPTVRTIYQRIRSLKTAPSPTSLCCGLFSES